MGNEADEWASLWAHYTDRSYVNPVDPKDQGDSSRKSHQISVTTRREIANKAKDRPCMDCGVCYEPCVMDFDHVRGVKVMDISSMVQKHYSLGDLQREIDKCDVVCANCHRVRTNRRMRLDNTLYESL